ncbi:MBL fold metallo-hydrolase [Dactylosporangium sp. CA-052675]|uniref:MBL fold metallo-hydrolase n=1 Tax=Dactylosporangium sp. CA-052675 TaxID=3239927 RepID=UPI003D8FDFA5
MTVLREIAAGVHVLRHPVLDVNATLVVGGEAALVADTLSTAAQARDLLAAVRRVTPLPVLVVNTHHHFDHCFGNMVFAAGGCPIWSHEEAARLVGPALRDRAVHEHPDLAADLAAVTPTPATRLVRTAADLDLGDRPVRLRHYGRGHSIGDLVALVPDADVAVAGDLVEQSGPPQFDDAFPLEWPDTVAALLAEIGPQTQVVPGHGSVVTRRFMAAQHEQLAALAWLIREGDADGAPPERLAAKSPFPHETTLPAIHRGYLHLNQP